jgi:ubiquinone/menaquinone biosynthesis C-methylase UbiE
MKKQKEIFKNSEADEWFLRNNRSNSDTKVKDCHIIKSLKELEIVPKKILEIGCSNGIRLNNLNNIFGSECFGIDPSDMAIENGKKQFPNISLKVGLADLLPFESNSFDLIIFGFCLYVCDRSDLFKIALEADRCLSDKGYLVILDFYPPFPYKNKYSHVNGVFSYKMNYAKMFLWNPIYNEVLIRVFGHADFYNYNLPNEKVSVIILSKNEEFSYPKEPY